MAQIDTAGSLRANQRFFKAAMKVPLLEAEEELALATAWREQQDEKALKQLTSAYMRLVISMATRFRHYGLPIADLVQEGCVGLMQAADRFEPEKGVRFSTYATWWIRAAIQDYVLRNWSIVRTGTTAAQKALFFNLRRLRSLIKDGMQPQLSPESRAEIAETLGVSVKDVEMMEGRLAAADRSLNAPIGDEESGTDWQDLLVDERDLPEDEVMEGRDGATRKQWLEDALQTLNDRERMIIIRRRLGEEGITLEALGAELGISKERVRQIEHQALKKLKTELSARHPAELGLLASAG